MRAIIADQKMLLANLAEDIMNDGLSFGEPTWVTPDPEDPAMAIVIEGNRRITALKLMEQPQIAEGTVVHKRFTALAKKFADAPIRDVNVIVYPTAEDADKWLDRRHMSGDSGVSLQRWRPIAKNRRARARGQPTERFFAIHELLAENTDEWRELDSQLADKWTTVDRVLGSKNMPSLLGVSIDKTGIVTFENGDVDAGKSLLRRILKVVASKAFKFALIEGKDERAAFLQQFVPYAVKPAKGAAKAAPKPKEQPSAPGESSSAPAEGSPGLAKPKPLSTDRRTLAPANAPLLPVTGKRLGPLYRECREMVVEGNENAAALLFRVFLELSSEAFCAAKKPPKTQWMKDKGVKAWDTRGVRLDDKIEAALTVLDPGKRDGSLDQARVALNHETKAHYSIATLHGYFHNLEWVPDAKDIKGAWEAWESYLMGVHKALNPE
jgi:hypothetical protein